MPSNRATVLLSASPPSPGSLVLWYLFACPIVLLHSLNALRGKRKVRQGYPSKASLGTFSRVLEYPSLIIQCTYPRPLLLEYLPDSLIDHFTSLHLFF